MTSTSSLSSFGTSISAYNFECFLQVYLVTNDPLHAGHVQGTYRSAINYRIAQLIATNVFVMVTVWRENAAVVYIERAFETKMSVTLSKEQAAVLLPLLPNLAGLVAAAQPAVTANSDGVHQQEPSYSVSEMFEKKKKNTRSTFAQNYLLVSP